MFVWSFRSSSVKFFAALAAGVALVLALVVLLPDASTVPAAEETLVTEVSGVRTDGMNGTEDLVRLLGELGYTAEIPPVDDRAVVIPGNYAGAFAEYVKMQKEQGFDLPALAGKEVRRAVFAVRSKETGAEATATLFVYRGCIVGADIAEPGGAAGPLFSAKAENNS